MSEPSFIPGQRWVSNTEAELGLGIIIEVTDRRVEISFPAAGERRTYAVNNAPLSRVRYEVGQQISSADEQQYTVTEVVEQQGGLIYHCLDQAQQPATLSELELNSFVQFSKPQDRLFAGQIDKNKAFNLRFDTLNYLHQQQQSEVAGLLGARVQLLPHQLYIAAETGGRYAPRVLLADEVGLGKTIEAGLILHQQLLTGRAQRVLIVVPDSLVHQWLVEMLRRFNLYFTVLDNERCQSLAESGEDNPFESTQLALCSLSLFTEYSERLQQAVDARWDLLIVDEAHHLAWSEQAVSPAYRAVESLARQAQGLLLLTATPEQLGIDSHFARLRLLDPDRYYDLATFKEEEASYQQVNALVQDLLAEQAASELQANPELLQRMTAYLGEDNLEALQQAVAAADNAAIEQLLPAAVHLLLDHHGTGRVLFRNTRASVKGFPERRLQGHELALPEVVANCHDMAQVLAPETLFGHEWVLQDPRVEWLASWLKTQRGKKVLVICADAETALDLEEYLRLRKGTHSAVFHEGLSLVNRDRAAAYFADLEEGAQVLVCSEIGSEGRNFQFAHQLVLFDLPANPDLLEQRIGRLDRIGQTQTVEIHVPFYRDSAQQVLMRWYHEGLNAFERTCPVGQAVRQQFAEPLNYALANGGDHEAVQQLLDESRQLTDALLAQLQQGRDRLLELNSCNPERAQAIVEAMQAAEQSDELADYMEQVYDQFGVECDHHSEGCVILHPGDHMVGHSFPSLPDDGMTATFNRDTALSREDMHFLSWEHPMVSGAMDMVMSGEFGNTAFCTLKLPPLKPGTLMLEAVFTVSCSAPSELQLQRYLPVTPVRVLLDNNGTNLSNVLTPKHIKKLGQKIGRRNAQELVKHAREQIVAMISQAEQLAQEQEQRLVADARERMNSQQSAELKRMQALAAVNPNIRQEELAYMAQTATSLDAYLQGAQLRLDAIRVVLVTD